jgi:hypothetical protein
MQGFASKGFRGCSGFACLVVRMFQVLSKHSLHKLGRACSDVFRHTASPQVMVADAGNCCTGGVADVIMAAVLFNCSLNGYALAATATATLPTNFTWSGLVAASAAGQVPLCRWLFSW